MSVATSAALIGRASGQTGLSDFGPEGWREGLDWLVAAMSEREFGAAATARIEARLTDVLATRLRIEDWIARHPEVLDERIEGPVFILGLPRTATTALQAFLANDPQWRYLRGWEAGEPVPPPDITTEAGDPRNLAERARQDRVAGDGHSARLIRLSKPMAEEARRLQDRGGGLGIIEQRGVGAFRARCWSTQSSSTSAESRSVHPRAARVSVVALQEGQHAQGLEVDPHQGQREAERRQP